MSEDGQWEECECEPPDYGSQDFWEAHFSQASSGAATDPTALEFEWLSGDWKVLLPLLTPHLPEGGRILHPGCGMSLLPIFLQREVHGQILSVDSSGSCINLMRERYTDHPGLTWEVLDVTKLDELEPTFDAAVEKGCLDALLCCSDQEAAQYVRGLATSLPKGAALLVVSNSMARHRHLQGFFEVQETIPIDPEEPLFGPCLYICRRL